MRETRVFSSREGIRVSEKELKTKTNANLTQKSRQKPLSLLKRIQFVRKFTALGPDVDPSPSLAAPAGTQVARLGHPRLQTRLPSGVPSLWPLPSPTPSPGGWAGAEGWRW